jgi:hypothetical protein
MTDEAKTPAPVVTRRIGGPGDSPLALVDARGSRTNLLREQTLSLGFQPGQPVQVEAAGGIWSGRVLSANPVGVWLTEAFHDDPTTGAWEGHRSPLFFPWAAVDTLHIEPEEA